MLGEPPPPIVRPSRAASRRARVRNLLGLVTPVANLGLVGIAPRDVRWSGVGAGVLLSLAAGWGLWRGVAWVPPAAGAAHYALVLAGLVDPIVVAYPARAWNTFGAAFGKVMAYPVFAAVYFLVVTPLALVMRASGRDPLRRGAPPGESYWVPREPPPPERYERQF